MHKYQRQFIGKLTFIVSGCLLGGGDVNANALVVGSCQQIFTLFVC